jgi:hypothetical protein
MDDVKVSSSAKDYRKDAADTATEAQKVMMWRRRIARSLELLQIEQRGKDAAEGDLYLTGRKEAKGQKTYGQYILPIIEDLHRRTLPSLPMPMVEAQTEASERYEETARQILSLQFSRQRNSLEDVCRQIQWDDSRYGAFVAKVGWRIDEIENPGESVTDVDRLAAEVERATGENADPLNARILEEDIDAAHLREHLDAWIGLNPLSPEYEALEDHIREHQARLTTIRKEHPVLIRVRPWDYCYDPDVPWRDRGWEAERQSVRIKSLIEQGYKAVNPENVPAEMLPAQLASPPYEDMTARVWFIHDRAGGQQYVLSADGPEEGRFLHKSRWPWGARDIYYKGMFRPDRTEFTWGVATIPRSIPILERLATTDFYIDRHVENHAQYKPMLPDNIDGSKIKAQMNDPNRKWLEVPERIYAGAGIKEYAPPAIPEVLLSHRAILLNELRRFTGLDAQDVSAAHPHQISATEASHRSEVAKSRRMDRQEVMAAFLSWVAEMFLCLMHDFATQGLSIRETVPDGKTVFRVLEPKDLPLEFDVMLDVHAESEAKKAIDVANAREFVNLHLQSDQPTDTQRLLEWYGRSHLGIRRPEQFRRPLPEGPQNIQQPLPSQPSAPNEAAIQV